MKNSAATSVLTAFPQKRLSPEAPPEDGGIEEELDDTEEDLEETPEE